MPSIDILIPLFFLAFFGGYKLFETHRPVYFWAVFRLLIVVLLVHLAVVGYVWQWIPLYITLAFLLVLSLKTLKINQPSNGVSGVRKALWATAITLSVIALGLIWIFPLRSLPEPTGTLSVGTFSWSIETDRLEAYTPATDDLRRFRVQAWYPALESSTQDTAKWLIDGGAPVRGMAEDFGFPGFIFNHLATVEAHALVDAQAQSGTYPVAIISHGWTGFRNLHTDLAEELASQGYIVFGTNHAYGSVATVFGEDDIAPLNNDALPPRATTANYLEYANTLVSTFSEDILDLVDELETLNNDPSWALYGRLNLDQIALIGHSTGGGASVKAAITDARIKTVIGLDAWVEPLNEKVLNEGLSVPSLLLRSEAWEISFNNAYLYTLMGESAGDLDVYQVAGTTHYDFGMVYMFSTLSPFIGLQGSLGMEMPALQNALVLTYLNHQFRHDPPVAFTSYEGLTPVLPSE